MPEGNSVQSSKGEWEELPPTQPSEVDQEACSKWWFQVGVAGYRLRALFDIGAFWTGMNSINLQFATACGKELIPASGLTARVTNGQTIAVVGFVYLPMVGSRRNYARPRYGELFGVKLREKV